MTSYKRKVADDLQAIQKTANRRLPNYVAAYHVLYDLVEKLRLELES